MALKYHPDIGTIVICDFSGSKFPEMDKKRPAIVISPRFRDRGNLCSVVPLSTTAPKPVKDYHFKLHMETPLPDPYGAFMCWVKADMIYTVSFERLSLPFEKKSDTGQRIYDCRKISDAELIQIRRCILHGIGLSSLTEHLK